MPTARELLEEADALMKRNRLLQADDIPLLTDSVPVPTEAQVLRGRGAASRAGVPVAYPAHAAEPDNDGLDSIPTLTETVGEEVEVVAVQDDGGEPSDWLRRDAGEPSITGEVPDSVLVVPPPEETELADEEPFFDDDSAPAAEPHSHVKGSVDFDDVEGTEEIELVAPAESAVEEAFEAEDADHVDATLALTSEAPSMASPAALPAVDSLAEVPPFVADIDAEDESTIIDTAMDEDEVPEEPGAPPEPVAPAFTPATLAPEPVLPAWVPEPVPEPLLAASVPDATKWEGVAEEIRMQVLQRIDIFTDTGLRDQLSLRLQPIVDRASADLVATINQHVGDLLRAYVAEAIEREIESWRRNH